jgi:hypothetical protein
LWLAIAILASGVAAAQDRIRISIKNEYITTLNFGVLGKGSRDGMDTAEGVLEFRENFDERTTEEFEEESQEDADVLGELQTRRYVGIVTAFVSSTQTLAGLGGVGSCGPGNYRNSQQLQVIGRQVGRFNTQAQNVTPATIASQATEYLVLEFVPVPGTELQPPNPNRNQDQVIDCHTIIETAAGRFLPLNDSRWTMEGGGYIIALPSSGTINYTDDAGPRATDKQIGPFKVKKSVWTIEVERLR